MTIPINDGYTVSTTHLLVPGWTSVMGLDCIQLSYLRWPHRKSPKAYAVAQTARWGPLVRKTSTELIEYGEIGLVPTCNPHS